MENQKTLLELLIQYGQLAIISIFFGVGNFINKVRNNKLKLNKFDFFSELLFATMAGYLTFRICEKFQFDMNNTAILIAINSYCGSKFLDMMQKITVKWIAKKIASELEGLASEEEIKKEDKPED